MTPANYKALIIKTYIENTEANYWSISETDFQTFADITRTFGSGQLVLEHWAKFLQKGNRSIKDFIDWCMDIYLEDEGNE